MRITGILIFIFALAVLAILMNSAANLLESQPTRSIERFEIVDQYQNCDVIRYTPDHSAKYAYFLDCPK